MAPCHHTALTTLRTVSSLLGWVNTDDVVRWKTRLATAPEPNAPVPSELIVLGTEAVIILEEILKTGAEVPVSWNSRKPAQRHEIIQYISMVETNVLGVRGRFIAQDAGHLVQPKPK